MPKRTASPSSSTTLTVPSLPRQTTARSFSRGSRTVTRSTLSNLKNGHARKLGAEKLNSFSSYFTHKLGRKITVEYLIGKEPESQTNANIPKGIPLTMYDEAADTESSSNIKTTVVTYSRVAQYINDPVLRKIVNTCLESPEYIQPLSIMLDQLIKISEVKNDTESKNS